MPPLLLDFRKCGIAVIELDDLKRLYYVDFINYVEIYIIMTIIMNNVLR